MIEEIKVRVPDERDERAVRVFCDGPRDADPAEFLKLVDYVRREVDPECAVDYGYTGADYCALTYTDDDVSVTVRGPKVPGVEPAGRPDPEPLLRGQVAADA